MGTVGSDFGPYREYFEGLGIDLSRVRVIDELFTPQAFITTDHDNNQITAFHPGAMMRSYENHVRGVPGVTLGLVGPDGREGMIQNAQEFHEDGIPFIFDPGQAMPLFNGRNCAPSSSRPTTWWSTTTSRTCCRSAPAGTKRRSSAGSRPTSPPVARKARSSTPGKEL